jgi:hypothetical protein
MTEFCVLGYKRPRGNVEALFFSKRRDLAEHFYQSYGGDYQLLRLVKVETVRC